MIFASKQNNYQGRLAYMNINTNCNENQQNTIQLQITHSNLNTFSRLLGTTELCFIINESESKQRNRLYPSSVTLSMFVTQALSTDGSCQNIVNSTAIDRINTHPSLSSSTATGGYCRARQRLPLELISRLVHKTNQLTDNVIPRQWRWRGKRVHLIDGTTLSMPDTAANQSVYPQQSGQKAGLGFPICRVVGAICLSSGSLSNVAIGPYKGKGGSEQALLRQLVPTFDAGDVIVGDALYGSYFLLSELMRLNIDMVFEQLGGRKSTIDFKKGKRLGVNDHLIQLNKPSKKPEWMSEEDYNKHPDSLQIREVKVSGKVLITNQHSREEVPKTELKKLYKKRWNIEMDLRNIKTTMGMGILSCKTPLMIEKEIWIYFLAYNLVRLLMVNAALLSGSLPRQLSFKHCLQLCTAYVHKEFHNHLKAKACLLIYIGQRTVGSRPGRVEPRAIKRRPKPYPLLMNIRASAQKEIRENGHIKKLK